MHKSGRDCIVILVMVAVFSTLWSRYQTHRLHVKIVEKAKLCRTNLKKFANGATMYEADHGGKLPKDLREIGPEYLSPHPTCPFDGSAYQARIEIMTDATADLFPSGFVEAGPGSTGLTVRCTSDLHAQIEPDLQPGYYFCGFKQAKSKLLCE